MSQWLRPLCSGNVKLYDSLLFFFSFFQKMRADVSPQCGLFVWQSDEGLVYLHETRDIIMENLYKWLENFCVFKILATLTFFWLYLAQYLIFRPKYPQTYQQIIKQTTFSTKHQISLFSTNYRKWPSSTNHKNHETNIVIHNENKVINWKVKS